MALAGFAGMVIGLLWAISQSLPRAEADPTGKE